MIVSAPLQITGNKMPISLEHLSLLGRACREIASKTVFRANPTEGEEAVLSKICLHIK